MSSFYCLVIGRYAGDIFIERWLIFLKESVTLVSRPKKDFVFLKF